MSAGKRGTAGYFVDKASPCKKFRLEKEKEKNKNENEKSAREGGKMTSHERGYTSGLAVEQIAQLCESKREEFWQNGAVLLENVFSEDWREKIKTGIEENLKNPSPYSESLR